MANTNAALSILCTSTGSNQYLKSQFRTSASGITSDGSAGGNTGDFFFADPSVYHKTAIGWVGAKSIPV